MKAVLIPACILLAFCCHSALQADEASLRRTLSEFVDVFNQQNAEKVASFWTENATHTDRETGERTEGRREIQADFAKVFAENSRMKLAASADRIRLITPDVARVEGQTTIVPSDADPVDSAFTAILVRQGDRWLFDSIEETAIPLPATSADALRELEWLIGSWIDESDGVKVKTTFRWSANQAFLLRSFTVESADSVALEGTQVIGWDSRGQQIRSWNFNSDGSFGESTWSKNGSSWLAKSTQTSISGEISAGTYVLEKIDHDSFTMQLIGHEIDSEPQPTGAPVKIIRVTDEPSVVPSSTNK
jgi:uncharacterized protein (TIGR02246 family)